MIHGREAEAFAKDVAQIAKDNNVPVTTANQIALSLLREGTAEPDMWDELKEWCGIWSGRIKANGAIK